MKIGYISVRPLLQNSGVEGGAIHIQEVCSALQRLGHDIFIVAGRHPIISKSIRVYDLSVPDSLHFACLRHKVRALASRVYRKLQNKTLVPLKANNSVGFKRSKLNFTTLSWSPIVFWRDIITRIDGREYDRYFFQKACQIIETEKPDVLYERFGRYCFSGVDLARHYRLPLILEMNGSNSFPAEWRQKYSPLYVQMIRQSERRIAQRADVVIVVVQPVKDYLVKLGVPQEKVFVVPNGVDVTRFFPNDAGGSAIRRLYGLDNNLVVGFVGGIRPYHGLNVLIDSARLIVNECPQVHFLIVGDGPPRGALELQVREQELTDVVTFTGSVPFQDVPAYINAMDVTVAPFAKVPHLYGSSIKGMEYMAVGKPIVASRCPITAEVVIDRQNGLLVEAGDEHQLAQAILELLMDKDLRERLGAEGRRTVEEKYTWEGNARKIIEIFENIRKSKKK